MKRTKQTAAAIFAALWVLLLAAPLSAQQSQDLAGDWEGALNISGVRLRLVFHIAADSSGALSATMDSPDQGANGIPVSRVAFAQDKLRLEVQTVGGVYEGVFDSEHQEIDGTWQQGGQSWPLLMQRSEARKPESKAGSQVVSEAERRRITGIWQGVLKVSGIELRIVFRITPDSSGVLAATMDSPDQGAKGIPTSKVIFQNDSLRIEVPGVGGFYLGKLAAEKSEISGEWQQMGRAMRLDLQRVEKEMELRRPQEPQPPFPYEVEKVQYENAKAGITLAGTLTKPKSGGPFPAVLLISGSGAQDRNEMIFGHKPFLVLADYLTRQGLAVLRVDDRGTGQSTGDFAKATTEDFAGDVEAGIDYLKTRPDIDPARIGLIGHSEGGLIAPMVAARRKDVAFIVLLAGPGLPGKQILLLQTEEILRVMGASEALVKEQLESSKHIFAILKAEPDDSVAAQKIRAYATKRRAAMPPELKAEAEKFGDSAANIDSQIKKILSPWFRFFLSYDPRPALEQVQCPVLALIGEKDLQVPAEENLPAIRKALKAGGNPHFVVKEMPGLNHLFQTAETGAPSEYGKIEETFAPKALQEIAEWILQQVGSR